MAGFYEKFTVKKESRSDSKKKNAGQKKNASERLKTPVQEIQHKKNEGQTKNAQVNKRRPLQHNLPVAESRSSLFNYYAIPADTKKILADFNQIISSTHPLNSKQKQMLPLQIRELSHYLTDERGERRLGYMNSPSTLTAYIHYFLWWNLVRLTRLFANLPDSFFNLKNGSICLDIGSGPLTVVTALFLARPELRKLKLTWYCMDISSQTLSLGQDIFLSTAAALKCEPWNIIRVKGEAGTSIKEKAAFITCANVFNEINEEPGVPPDYLAKKYSDLILRYADSSSEETRILVIEPGVPKSSRLISLMRDSFMRKKFYPVSPCTHCSQCPMDGKRGGKWCNLSFSTEDAPKALKVLSEKAELPKERAVLSFIALVKNTDLNREMETDNKTENETNNMTEEKPVIKNEKISFLITSDPIRLPGNRTGFYACSKLGLLLILTEKDMKSGQSFSVTVKDSSNLKTDEKSGALILPVA